MATYYCKSGAGGGGVGSFADPYTIQELCDNVTAGNEGVIVADATYSMAVPVDIDTNAGNGGAPINFRGGDNVDGSPVTGNARPLFTSNGLGATDPILNFNIADAFIEWKDFRVHGVTSENDYGILISSITDEHLLLENFEVWDNDVTGVRCECSVGSPILIEADIHDNGVGIGVNSAARGKYTLLRCRIYDNTTYGIQDSLAHSPSYAKPTYLDCDIWGNGSVGIYLYYSGTTYGGAILRGCVIDNNGTNGIELSGAGGLIKIPILSVIRPGPPKNNQIRPIPTKTHIIPFIPSSIFILK